MKNMLLGTDFSARRVLITGATRGIGKAIAEILSLAGAQLILTGTHREEIDELNRCANRAGNKKVNYIQADFSSLPSIHTFIDEIKELGAIDVCINNAGINKTNCMEEVSDEDYNKLISINLTAPFIICRALAPVMKKAGYGRIVNIASIWSAITKAERSLYTTAKSGLVGMTKTLSVELAPYNVLVNAVSPGFTITEMTKQTLTATEMKSISQQIPMGRFAQPEEIARVVMFLASEANTYITGQNIIADGGFVNV